MLYEWQPRLKSIAEKLGLEFFSSPFDFEGVDFLKTLRVCREAGNDDTTLLKCTSPYPVTISDADLATIPYMRDRYTEIFSVLDNNSRLAKLNQVMELRYVLDKNLIETLNEKT